MSQLVRSCGDVPLSERVFKTTCTTAPFISPLLRCPDMKPQRPEFYKQWDDDAMSRAMKAVLETGMSVRRAATEYNVPKSTLNDRIQGKVIHGCRSGPLRYLTEAEEEELLRFLIRSASIGYPKSRNAVIALVQRACNNKGLSVTVTHGWWEGFCRRNPSIVLRAPAQLSLARAKASDPEVFEHYFDLLESTLTEYDISDKPMQIFNMDETGVPLSPDLPKGVFKKGSKAVAVTSGDKSQLTVVACVSAGGFCIPPMVILDRKTLHPDMTIGELPGTIYGLSSKGWIDSELFNMWFNSHFLRYAPPVRPLLLLMDGHSTHFCPETIRLASEQDVIIFTLPPNTTHLAQPLDKGCFGPFKAEWKKVCHEHLVKEGRVVTRYSFSQLFDQAWMRSMTIKNIMAGFRVTGVYPLDRSKLLGKDEDVSKVIPFNPMISRSPYSKKVRACTSDEANEDFVKESVKKSMEEADKKWKEGFGTYTCSLDPDGDDSDNDVMMAKQTSRPLKAALEHPSPMPKINPHVQSNAKSSRVLTSAQNLKILNEKQLLKEQKIKLKEEKQRLRAEKARQKEEKQKDKSVQRRCTKETIEAEEEMGGEEIHFESDVDQSVFSGTVIEGDIEKEDRGATNLSETRTITEKSGVMTRGRKALLTDSTERTVEIKGVAVEKKEALSGKKGAPKRKAKEKVPVATTSTKGKTKKDILTEKTADRVTTRGRKPLPKSSKSDVEDHVYTVESEGSTDEEDDWWIKDLSLKQEDYLVLKDGGHLSDRIINASQLMLKEQYKVEGLQSTLCGENLSFRPPCKSDACIIQILHTGNSHWLCIVVNPATFVVEVMDSASSQLNEFTKLQIANIVNTMKPSFKIVVLPVQQQQGSSDCGLFSISFATAFCTGSNVRSLSFNQTKMRSHLLQCFKKRKIEPFPLYLRNVSKFCKTRVSIVKVYCTCRLPDFYDETMIRCDCCGKWYHSKCVQIDCKSVDDSDYWECMECGSE